MALDIYSMLAMSDELERVFSIAGNVLSLRRRSLTSDTIQWILYLRSWQNSEIMTLDQRRLRQAVVSVDSLPPLRDDEDDEITTPPIAQEDLLGGHEDLYQ
jgi:hypothetical protein